MANPAKVGTGAAMIVIGGLFAVVTLVSGPYVLDPPMPPSEPIPGTRIGGVSQESYDRELQQHRGQEAMFGVLSAAIGVAVLVVGLGEKPKKA